MGALGRPHATRAAATGLVLQQRLATHRPLRACPEPWALRKPPQQSWLREGTPAFGDTSARVQPQPIAAPTVSHVLASWTQLCPWPPVSTLQCAQRAEEASPNGPDSSGVPPHSITERGQPHPCARPHKIQINSKPSTRTCSLLH